MKLRIAAMSTDSGYLMRGADRTIKEIKKYMEPKGHVIDVYGPGSKDGVIKVRCLPRYSPAMRLIDRILNVTRLKHLLFYLPLPIDEFGIFSMSFYAKLIKERKKYDLIWVSTSTPGCVYGKIYSLLTGTPIVVTGHGGKIEKFLMPWRPDGFNAIDIEMAEWFELHKSDISSGIVFMFIRSGANIDLFRPAGKKFSRNELLKMARQTTGKVIERPIILSGSAIAKNKRIDLLIKAVSRMKKGTLIVASDGEEREAIVELGEKMLGRRFIYVGPLKDKELATLHRTCDVCSVPSAYESFGAVAVEAMASGKPVVTTDDVIRRWVVGDAGILLDVTDIEAYSKALEKAYRTRWGSKPRKRAEYFSWKRASEEYEKLFIEVVKKHGKGIHNNPELEW